MGVRRLNTWPCHVAHVTRPELQELSRASTIQHSSAPVGGLPLLYQSAGFWPSKLGCRASATAPTGTDRSAIPATSSWADTRCGIAMFLDLRVAVLTVEISDMLATPYCVPQPALNALIAVPPGLRLASEGHNRAVVRRAFGPCQEATDVGASRFTPRMRTTRHLIPCPIPPARVEPVVSARPPLLHHASSPCLNAPAVTPLKPQEKFPCGGPPNRRDNDPPVSKWRCSRQSGQRGGACCYRRARLR